jgi:hypothetical protein
VVPGGELERGGVLCMHVNRDGSHLHAYSITQLDCKHEHTTSQWVLYLTPTVPSLDCQSHYRCVLPSTSKSLTSPIAKVSDSVFTNSERSDNSVTHTWFSDASSKSIDSPSMGSETGNRIMRHRKVFF